MPKENQKFLITLFSIIFLLLFVIIFAINRYMTGELGKIEDQSSPIVQPLNIQPANLIKKKIPVTEKIYMDPNRVYTVSVFFQEGKEIARYKTINHEIVDQQGIIPDGDVKFENSSRRSYGTEHYSDNQRHGIFKEYFTEGQIRREAKYVEGKIWWNKEYFIDGTLRMEEYYEDSLISSISKETGHGKIYFRDGRLMYEWNLTNRDENRYKRSYNREGKLVAETYYDNLGQSIPERSFGNHKL